jgi:hypothetical protein
MPFVPTEPERKNDLVYFDDVESSDGWVGHTTGKSISTLKSDIVSAISRLGGLVSAFIPGEANITHGTQIIKRFGYRIEYSIETPDHKLVYGKIEIVALPIRDSPSLRRSETTRRDKSMRMALYMACKAIEGWWYLEKLSPGYMALMPFMLYDQNRTVSQAWHEDNIEKALPAPKDGDVVDGEFKEVEK